MTPRPGLTKPKSLCRRQDFERIYSRGHKCTGPHLILFYALNNLGTNRLGLSTSKKRFKLSTQRHRLQRWLREAYRLNRVLFLVGYDLVISVHHFPQGQAGFQEIERELLFLAGKAGLISARPASKMKRRPTPGTTDETTKSNPKKDRPSQFLISEGSNHQTEPTGANLGN